MKKIKIKNREFSCPPKSVNKKPNQRSGLERFPEGKRDLLQRQKRPTYQRIGLERFPEDVFGLRTVVLCDAHKHDPVPR
jgi:hypothetical protein